MIFTSTNNKGDTVVNINAGDDGSVTIPLETEDHEPYELKENEYIIFAVREIPDEDSDLLINIHSELGSNMITFSHDDTADIEPGYYSAEAQLMKDGNKRITVWPKLEGDAKIRKDNRKNFCVMTQVVYE